MIKMTYAEYDRMEEICDYIREQNETVNVGTTKYFSTNHEWPTIEQLTSLDIENNLEDYFHYLFFWYTQKFDDQIKDNAEEYAQYKESMKYIKKIIDNNIVFIDS